MSRVVVKKTKSWGTVLNDAQARQDAAGFPPTTRDTNTGNPGRAMIQRDPDSIPAPSHKLAVRRKK